MNIWESLGRARKATPAAALVETIPGEVRDPQGSDNQHRLAELNPRGKHRLGIGKLNV
jgi:hypothetical protein